MRIEELSEAILSHPHSDDWHKRNEALASLEDLFESEAATSIVADDLRPLKLALQNALTDLRSTLIKGACQVLEALSRAAKDACSRLIRDLLPALVDQAGSSNKVIKSYTDPCLLELIRHVRFRQGIAAICSYAESHNQKGARQQCTQCMFQLLSSWGSPYCDSEAEALQHAIGKCLEDSCPLTRENARQAYGTFVSLYPNRAEVILASVGLRTRKTLTEEGEGRAKKGTKKEDSPGTPDQKRHEAESSAPESPQSQSRTSRQGTASCASSISTDHEDDEEPIFDVGQRVRVIRKPQSRDGKGNNPLCGYEGIVKFVGRTRFASGLWVGVDMGQAVGKNDGSIQGERYFSCSQKCGIFVRQSNLEELDEEVEMNNGDDLHGGRHDERYHENIEAGSESDGFGRHNEGLLLRQKRHIGDMLQMLEEQMLLLSNFERKGQGTEVSFTGYYDEAQKIMEKQATALEEFLYIWKGEKRPEGHEQEADRTNHSEEQREREILEQKGNEAASNEVGVLLG